MRHILTICFLLGWGCSAALSSQLLFKPHEAPVVCPGGKTTCPPSTTCCALKNGDHACCAHPEATCCTDGEHCCPKDYNCDAVSKQCVHSDGIVINWSKKVPSTPVPPTGLSKKSIQCPDKTQCMDEQTCCELPTGQYGCCPLPKATCCSDKEHCCPETYTCDPESARCVKAGIYAMFKTSPMVVPWTSYAQSDVSDVKCSDTFSCQTGQTCCKASRGFMCCPLPKTTPKRNTAMIKRKKAVCCADKKHCCPPGYKCDGTTGSCKPPTDPSHPLTLSLPWTSVGQDSGSNAGIDCPDKTSTCPDGCTCCMLASGKYGCCPLPDAVCCSDKAHCCPSGTTCNVAAGTCDRSGVSVPWSKKVPAIRNIPTETELPAQSEIPAQAELPAPAGSCSGGAWCKDGNTCCEAGPVRGCCPVNGVCCSDGLHCCPAGTTCDASAGMCRTHGSSLSFSWHQTRKIDGYGGLRKIESAPVVKCGDGSTCPQENTCCELPNKQYSCCPYETGICCEDKLHCCPHGMKCDLTHGRCAQNDFVLPWVLFTRRPAKHQDVLTKDRGLTVSKDTCPDLTSVCPENSTCCLLQSGAYGCCPHKNAVCCSDKLHCCPYGTTCDIEKQTCVTSAASNNKDVKNKEEKEKIGFSENDVPFPFLNPLHRLRDV